STVAASDPNPLHVGLSGQSAHETISCSESRSVFCDVIVCVLIEGLHRFLDRYLPVGHAARDYDQSGHTYIMSGFFEELQRRKVYRVAAAYIVAAGFLIQIASAAFPAWELPNWSLRLVIVLLLIGFPIALILAWAYDITAQGVQITPTKGAHRRRNLILLIVTAVIVSASAGFFLWPRAVRYKIDKSVAVLPFQNLSSDPENAYFADGIQEEVLTRLAKIADLKVISRASTQQYQSQPGNLAEIAKQLGVANILEGSVQKVADQVRVNVHLVNVQTGSQLWAETYDRKLSDIFVIESE